MGLQLSKTMDDGHPSVYWKIIRCEVDYKTGNTEVEIRLYKSKTASDGGNKHVLAKKYVIANGSIAFTAGDIRDEVYPIIKALTDFAGATDVLE